MERVPITLTEKQAERLVKGGMVQLPKSAVQGNQHIIFLAPTTAKKVRKAKMTGKGVRIQLSGPEMEATGAGLKDVFKKVGKFYTKYVKPVASKYIKKGVEQLADKGITALEVMAPEFAPALEFGREKFLKKGIDKLGDVTGAYGLSGSAIQNLRYGRAPPPKVSSDYFQMLAPAHPAFFPTNSQLPPIGGYMIYQYPVHSSESNKQGGSFKPSGGSAYLKGPRGVPRPSKYFSS